MDRKCRTCRFWAELRDNDVFEHLGYCLNDDPSEMGVGERFEPVETYTLHELVGCPAWETADERN